MGRHAAQKIVDRMQDPDAPPSKTVLEPILVVRGTTAVYKAQLIGKYPQKGL